MNDAFDQLERELTRALRARRPRQGRPRSRRATALAAVGALLAISAGALAATRALTATNARSEGDELALQITHATATHWPCELLPAPQNRLVVSDGAPGRSITALLPALGSAVPLAERDRTVERLSRGHVDGVLFASSIRTVHVAPFLDLLVAVGARESSVRDPEACTQMRLAAARQRARGRPPMVLQRAQWRLRSDPAAAPGVQTLYVFELPRPARHGELLGGGGADPVSAARPLRPGITLVGNEPDGSRVLVGIARPAATQVELHAAAVTGRTRAPVVEGFFAVRIPRAVKRFSLTEVAADGRSVGAVDLRQ